MKTVLAIVDAGPAARPVLDVACHIALLTDAAVRAVHVRESSGPTPEPLAVERSIAFRELTGHVETTILDELDADDVIIGVVGARGTRTGRRPVGHVAMRLLRDARKPVVVVPPDVHTSGALHRLLIPLEGTHESARPLTDRLVPLLVGENELIVVHVFTTATAPAMVDHPDWGLDAWSGEFLARHLPDAKAIELRTGAVGGQILDAATETNADIVVLSWSQDPSPGHAAVIRDVLERSPIPVLLIPVQEWKESR